MFQEGNYDIIEFPMPREGMNQFISPEVLPTQFAYLLENILPTPLGAGQVRYGTREITLVNNPEATILEAFAFTKPTGGKQMLLYTQYYVNDTTIQNPIVNAQTTLTFASNNPNNYQADTPIKVLYTFNGINYTLKSQIQAVAIVNQTVTLTLTGSVFPVGVIQVQSVWYAAGTLYCYDFDNQTMNQIWQNNLSVACIPRGAYFQQALLLCNGVDRILSWDGTTLQEVVDFVKERQANTFNRIDNTHFSFVKLAGFDNTKYAVGNLIQLNVNGVSTTLTIANIAIANNLVTITTQENLPAFTGQDRVELFYRDWPPTFNYLFAGTDRLWALGPGAAGVNFRTNDQALRVYYTYEPNTLTNWFNENTKTVPSIDMSDKQGSPDNFEAICQVNGLTAFIGRSKTQVWSGSIPGDNGDFQWNANLPVGIAHGNLLINLPNDAYFVSQNGLQSFSTLNIAKQFSATSFNAVDPLVNTFLSDISSSNMNYRACRSFKYEQGNLAGFKIGQNKILASLFQTNLYAWVLLSGDFQASTSFVDLDSALYLSGGNTVFQYADGNDGGQRLYGDQNGAAIIPFVWVPGVISMRGRSGKRFANKRYELILNYSSNFTLNEKNKIFLKINGYIPRTFELLEHCQLQPKGDVLGEVPLGEFRLQQAYEFLNRKLKFVSASFWISLYGYAIDGPVSFKKLRLFGVGERHG